MKILLDECIDRRLAGEIEDHEVVTVSQIGWAGIQNGNLLGLAQEQFDVFVTVIEIWPSNNHCPSSALGSLSFRHPRIDWKIFVP